MSVAQNLPQTVDSDADDAAPPVVTLIGTDFPSAYLDDAEPSPIMESASRMWQSIVRLIKIVLVLVLVGGYPAAIVLSHQVDDSDVVLPRTNAWASPETGTMLTLLGRELTGAGWAQDRPIWHPQARLTALPAWQDGLTTAMSDYAALMAELSPTSDGGVDVDLDAASRLLAPAGDITAEPRLNAAAEALQRYDGRLSRNLAKAPTGLDAFDAQLALFSDWAVASREALRKSADTAEAWPASRDDIRAVYMARAYAHAASQLMLASLTDEPQLLDATGATEASDKAFFAWRRAAEFNPLVVTSQAGTGRILSDHPATLAFYMAEAETATADLRAALKAPSDAAVSVASAG